jgi:hypothetical protein
MARYKPYSYAQEKTRDASLFLRISLLFSADPLE